MLVAGMLVGSLPNKVKDIEIDLTRMILVEIIFPQYVLQREVLPVGIEMIMINECDSVCCEQHESE